MRTQTRTLPVSLSDREKRIVNAVTGESIYDVPHRQTSQVLSVVICGLLVLGNAVVFSRAFKGPLDEILGPVGYFMMECRRLGNENTLGVFTGLLAIALISEVVQRRRRDNLIKKLANCLGNVE